MKYCIGCSGYYYPQWKNKLYPARLQPKNWLSHYSSIFHTVELNGTFYRTPTLANLKKYHSVTPSDFVFSVKMSKSISHVQQLKEKQPILDFQHLMKDGLKEKLIHFLFQMPPSFRYSEENLHKVIRNIPHHSQNVIEFRHLSWWNVITEQALKKANITFCNVDFPGLKSYFIHTTSSFYLRLHGTPELFKSSYDHQRLKQFSQQFPAKAQSSCIYFNNTMYEAGYQNAMELMEIVRATGS